MYGTNTDEHNHDDKHGDDDDDDDFSDDGDDLRDVDDDGGSHSSDGGAMRLRFAAGFDYLRDHSLGIGGVSGPVAEIIDNNTRAALGERERMGPSQALACTRNDGHLPIQSDCHADTICRIFAIVQDVDVFL